MQSPGKRQNEASNSPFVWVLRGATEHPAFLLTPLEGGPNVKVRWTNTGGIETVNASSVRVDAGWSETRGHNTRTSSSRKNVAARAVVTPPNSVARPNNLHEANRKKLRFTGIKNESDESGSRKKLSHSEKDDTGEEKGENEGPNVVYRSEDSEVVYYEVEKILKRKVVNGKGKFQIKWAGVDEITWEPEEHLCDSVLEEARAIFKSGLDRDSTENPLDGRIVCIDQEKGGYCSEDSEEEVVYWEVDKLLKRKIRYGEELFLVKWKGNAAKPSWEPADHLCDTAIEEARKRFSGSQPEDDVPITLIPTSRVIENFKEVPNLTSGEVTWQSEPTSETSVNFVYLLGDMMQKKHSRKWPSRRKPRLLELFAGIGGMSLGFREAGFDTKWLVEKNSLAAVRQKLLHPEAQLYEEHVGMFLDKAAAGYTGYPDPEEVDHVHASPPCQGFSRANRYGGNQVENNKLSLSFVHALKIFEPCTGTLENVEGMFQTKHLPILKRMISKILNLGYQVRISILDSSSYGDPQVRKRVFLFVAKRGWPLPPIPPATHGARDGLKPLRTVREALSDLELIPVEEGSGLVVNHDDKFTFNHHISQWFSCDTELGDRINPDKPSSTVLTASRQIHYKFDRSLSVREVARLMSFPDDFQFFGSKADQYAQLGNSVPVKLATAVAKSVASTYGMQ